MGPGYRFWAVLGLNASRLGLGAFRHKGGGGGVADGGEAPCWALLLLGF